MDLTDKEKYTEQKAISETTNIKTDGCSEGCAGCGCFLIFAIFARANIFFRKNRLFLQNHKQNLHISGNKFGDLSS